MSGTQDRSIFVEDPRLLVELCRYVVEQLDTGSDQTEVKQQEVQLREIARTIERLEKTSVPVPDVLRAEKTRLAAVLALNAAAVQALRLLADEFEVILTELRIRLGQSQVEQTTKPGAQRQRWAKAVLPKTSLSVLRVHITQALNTLGGRATVPEVMDQMKKQLEGLLLPGDLELREGKNECVWQRAATWERFAMTQDGSLRSDSPRGIWELNGDAK
jgi:orotate phosphoribosyltransferase-like protein